MPGIIGATGNNMNMELWNHITERCHIDFCRIAIFTYDFRCQFYLFEELES